MITNTHDQSKGNLDQKAGLDAGMNKGEQVFMQPSSTEARIVEPTDFDAYLNMLAVYFDLETAALFRDGIGEAQIGRARVSYAIRRELSFAALRWTESGIGPCEVQTFFVCPATKAARAMVRVTSLSQDGQTDSIHPFIELWRVAVSGVEDKARATWPDFMELVGVLASDGQSAILSGELLSQVRSLEAELEYARIAAADQDRELSTARENIKLISIGDAERARTVLLRESSGEDTVPVATPNTTLADLPEWARNNAARIVILPRALAGAKKSQYESPETVMAALEFLAGPYREHKRGAMSWLDFEAALKQQPFQMANSVAVSVAGEQGDQYYVRWAGRRVFMDQHLLKGGGREARYCLRIYFFWDPGSSRAIVGSLPLHLDNRLS